MSVEQTEKWHEDLARASNLIPLQNFNNETVYHRGLLQRNLKLKPHDPTAWHDFLRHLNAERRNALTDDPSYSGKRSALITLYRIATDSIPKTATNRHSQTYLALWLEFAALQAEQPEEAYLARETFKSLKLLRIGQTLPQFWSAWSDLERRLGNPDKAARLQAEAEARAQPKNSTAKHNSAAKTKHPSATPSTQQSTQKPPFSSSRPPTRPPLRTLPQHPRDEPVPASPSISMLPPTPVAKPVSSHIPEPTPPRQVISRKKPVSPPERMRRESPHHHGFERPVLLSPEEQPPSRSVSRVGSVRARSPQQTPSLSAAMPSVQRSRAQTPVGGMAAPISAAAHISPCGMVHVSGRMGSELESESPQDFPQDRGTGGPMMTPIPKTMPGFLDGKSTITVNQRQYMMLGVAGRGGSSKVFKVLSSTMEVLALKRVRVSLASANFKTTFDSYANEINLLQRLREKPSIVTCFDAEVREDLGTIQLIMEYGDTDLARQLSEKRNRNESNKRLDRRMYWSHMLEAVRTIHEEKIVHSDLKPANFLCVSGQLKLIDFGIANAIPTDDTTKIFRDSQQGTPNYMSPETLIEYEGDEGGSHMDISMEMRPAKFRIGRASDIWSLGCILYQMVYGAAPYAHIRNMMQKLRAIQDPNHRIQYGPVNEPYVVDVLQGCLQHDPAERMSIPELQQHRYILGAAADGVMSGGTGGDSAQERKAIGCAFVAKLLSYQSISLEGLRDEFRRGDRSTLDKLMDDVARRVEADREPRRVDAKDRLRSPSISGFTNSNHASTRDHEFR